MSERKAPKILLQSRCYAEEKKRIGDFRAWWERAYPGQRMSESAAVRVLALRGLDGFAGKMGRTK